MTIVLLPRGEADLWESAAMLLRRHSDENVLPGQRARLDYFTVGRDSLDDLESAKLLGVTEDEDLAKNVCLVERLRPDFVPGAIVTPDGRWFDLTDHGWRFIDEDSSANRAAWAQWSAQVRAIFDMHRDHIAVEVDTHS